MRITVVTPSLNQGAFIERTIESVRRQEGDFEIEHVVVDGGSTDGTLEILRRQGGRIRWISEPDRGQSDALNKGFRMASGEILCWLNSDDVHEPGALAVVARALAGGGARWCFGECRVIDESDREVRRLVSWYKSGLSRRYSLARLLGHNFIPQPATFFTRAILDAAGPLDESFRYAMDYDLWLRFARIAPPVFVRRTLAGFRWHGGSTTGANYRVGAWEAFRIARRRARPGEGAAVARHFLNYLGQMAVYGFLDLLPARVP